MIEKILDSTCGYIREYILNTTIDNRTTLLRNEKIRNKFLENENHYEFVWLVQSLLGQDLLTFIDDSMLNRILSDNRVIDKINCIMNVSNIAKNKILKDNRIISKFHSEFSSIQIYISNLNEEFGQSYFDYLLKSNRLSDLKYLNSKVLDLLINDEINKSKLLSEEVNPNFLVSLSKNSIEELLNYKKYETQFLDYDIMTINMILLKGVTIPNFIINNREFSNKIITTSKISVYRTIANNLMKNNMDLYDSIEKSREKYYDFLINNIKDDGLLKFYSKMLNEIKAGTFKITNDSDFDLLFSINKFDNSNNDIYPQFVDKSKKVFYEILIDRYFKDNPSDVLINIQSIVDFNKELSYPFIPEERMNVYNRIINFKNLTLEEQKKLYFDLSDINFEHQFYDDFISCKGLSYKMLNEQTIDFKKMRFNKETFDKYKIQVFEFSGQDFNILVHGTGIKKEKTHDLNNFWNIRGKGTISLSLIGSNNLGTFQNPKEYLNVGFNKINPNYIMHISHTDSFTTGDLGSRYINEIHTPKKLNEYTKGYNEILYLENNEVVSDILMPTCIVCYDEVTSLDVDLSRNMSMPIVLIHTQYYNNKTTSIDFNNKKYGS